MSTALITGANKGIGFGLVKQFAADPSFSLIFATTRAPEKATELQKFAEASNGRVHVVRLEITQASITQAAQEVESKLGGKGLDVLVNNIGACIMTFDDFMTPENLSANFETNVISVQMVTDGFVTLLKKGNLKKIVNIGSAAGSITVAPNFMDGQTLKMGWAPYAVSKAALHMLTELYAKQLSPLGFTVFPLHPGLVKTDILGGDERFLNNPMAIEIEESTSKVFALINKTSPADIGKLFNYDGTVLPW